MNSVFNTIDKVRPVYDIVDKAMLFICKILLIIDILIVGYGVLARYIPQIPGALWCEEVVLTCMAYMTVFSAALAIRRGSHIRMTAFDPMLPKKAIIVSDIISSIAVFALAFVMVTVGWEYANKIGARGHYTSFKNITLFWKFLPIPIAGVAMIVFEIEAIYTLVKKLVLGEDA